MKANRNLPIRSELCTALDSYSKIAIALEQQILALQRNYFKRQSNLRLIWSLWSQALHFQPEIYKLQPSLHSSIEAIRSRAKGRLPKSVQSAGEWLIRILNRGFTVECLHNKPTNEPTTTVASDITFCTYKQQDSMLLIWTSNLGYLTTNLTCFQSESREK